VLAFSVLAQALSPKRFAGLFSAAPAVAIAGLIVVLLDKGAHEAHQNTTGMIAGATGMVAYAALVVPLLARTRAVFAATLALGGWLGVAALLALPILLS
jgi:Protein of unknown function (DUF3147)